MDSIYTVNDLLIHLKTWRSKNPNAKWICGSTDTKSKLFVYCYLDFLNIRFKIHSDTTVEAIDFLLAQSEGANPNEIFLITNTSAGTPCLRIKGRENKANGWNCYFYSLANRSAA